MVEPSIFFEKIAPNQYLYRNNRLRSSRAYLITYKEKRAIENLFKGYMGLSIGLTSSCSATMYFRPKIGGTLFIISSLLIILKFKMDMKKIIGNRKKIPCHKEPFFSIFEREAQTVSWRDILELTLGMIFVFCLSIILFNDAMTNNKKSLLILAVLALLASLFSSYMIFLLIRHKPKKDQNT
ncbi:hypothetical protein [Legionella fairfieldensis]|uniref:hypothetical protein n=1 Tax=Legionella fairfieldensis TaxID=45064 RepID=UPI00048A77A9|nr:hypothetical protein [Legionella fairfieldensis]